MFLAYKILRFGVSQAKKKHDKTKLAKNQTQPWPEPAPQYYYQNQYPPGYPPPQAQAQAQPYPPAGTNMHIPMPSTFSSNPPPAGTEDTDTASTAPGDIDKKTTRKTHLETCLRIVQFALSLAVIGLYGQDIQPTAPSSDPKWVYAVVVGFVSAMTAFVVVLCNLLLMKARPLRSRLGVRLPVFVWEAVLVVNWVVVFGVFAGVFLRDDTSAEGDDGADARKRERMRHAVYVDLVCWVLFSGSCVLWGARWWKSRRAGGAVDGNGEKGVEM